MVAYAGALSWGFWVLVRAAGKRIAFWQILTVCSACVALLLLLLLLLLCSLGHSRRGMCLHTCMRAATPPS
jgi:hypothetical protein